MEILCPGTIIAGIAALFVLHRFWNGKLRLSSKHSTSSGSAIALQEIVEPNVQHVIQVKEVTRRSSENGEKN